jgi:protein-S-isoprenylcysteine O-methyltransferase
MHCGCVIVIERQKMTVYPPEIIGPLWGVFEVWIALTKRSKPGAVSKGRHSLGIIWSVNLSAVAASIVAAYRLPSCHLPWPKLVVGLACCLFVVGLILRWYSIIHLGRFFTANVAIARDHYVVDSGPYHFVRHPRYTGLLLIALGYALSFQNWASLLIMFVPLCAVILNRIHVEEAALLGGLGDQYRGYMQRTKRLIPTIY